MQQFYTYLKMYTKGEAKAPVTVAGRENVYEAYRMLHDAGRSRRPEHVLELRTNVNRHNDGKPAASLEKMPMIISEWQKEIMHLYKIDPMRPRMSEEDRDAIVNRHARADELEPEALPRERARGVLDVLSDGAIGAGKADLDRLKEGHQDSARRQVDCGLTPDGAVGAIVALRDKENSDAQGRQLETLRYSYSQSSWVITGYIYGWRQRRARQHSTHNNYNHDGLDQSPEGSRLRPTLRR